MAKISNSTPAAARGEVQAGATRDKTPGFDPAVAPFETDAEAADTQNPVTEAGPQRSLRPKFENDASFANAMRPVENEPELQPRSNWPLMMIAAVVLIAAAVFLAASLLR
ncbi:MULTISPECIES: hypothetical protein [unclassified Mesorhizobium]|uniref:hypothetical protein n=1 Tax=unclassified Mesorhizobium TaxID=325217 RepID=UPI00112BC65B|nr:MULTISPECIES: hypothetical protein [unclassified Mesorhizobium]MBZ9702749.1 hypothetical protein [Mesorhizobium sp. CO1-1-3]MBZ9948532.1 hypothetical protein [Mesorhizobium sp. BR1-1-11]MBZ9951752.1 hypothetical protein [Mesorhizobium sp. BR1-1-15]MBZ9972162.1 hypothetical protein [Mesorhizobium sp. BR1-1-12]MCA0025138.1 hypothetical protein [Mesorhizobium sp. B263B1A]